MPGGGSCERKTGEFLQNSKFLSLDFVDFPDFPGTPKLDESTRSFDDCQRLCLQNTSCSAFTYKYTGERKCTHRGEPLVNLFWSPATETRTFLRVAAGEKDRSNFTGLFSVLETVCPVRIQLPDPPKESKTTARNLGIIGTAFGLELLAGILSFWAFLRRYSQYRDMARALGLEFLPAGGPKRFTYAELKAATKDFSDEVGSGGFGVVYKGELPDRRVVAVKRLKDAAGSEADFWAEANIIARMHHLNLVRLWGFCAEKGQRMLVYEFIPNGSLDKYIFPPSPRRQRGGGEEEEEELEGEEKTRKPLLDWNIRYRIAVGVARAIAYLHEECLEWVLHRDIKPENILLDGDFCPKVSDFGMAKLTKEDRFSCSGVKGTQGYMAPEWVMPREPITAKADVYSFGMVLLEMVTGARNNKFQMSALQSEEWYFPVFAYEKVYVERRVEDIIDPRILDSYDSRAHLAMVDRMLKTAIWCLQERPEMRPSMGKVAKMLEGSVEITEPGKPTIFYLRDT
ncbi:unnamed protein product [Spirodela intermedia]|uniref:non-specific serine/threonine protein kinase n=1 Tax=Spirodela intermedia TaxID=51605 RepID=A0A7I8KAW3_SPIIN|nr:unnamed protein product [Spirodela intermedia]